MGKKPFFRIEYIAEKPKSKEKKKTELKTKPVKECSNERNYRDGECSYIGCPIYNPVGNWESKNKQCKYRIKVETKEVEGGMKELVKFIKKNGLNKDGKRLTDEEVAEIVEKLDEEELKQELTDQDKEYKEQIAISKKLDNDYMLKYKDEDDEAWKEYYGEKEEIKCGNCGANHTKEEAELGTCWYCGAKLKAYKEEDISDELIQYTIVHKDGKVVHKWLTQDEMDEMFKRNTDIAHIGVTK